MCTLFDPQLSCFVHLTYQPFQNFRGSIEFPIGINRQTCWLEDHSTRAQCVQFLICTYTAVTMGSPAELAQKSSSVLTLFRLHLSF